MRFSTHSFKFTFFILLLKGIVVQGLPKVSVSMGVPDTSIGQDNTSNSDSKKVTIGTGNNGFEISPSSNINNGLFMEPVNRAENKGLNSIFFLRDTSSWSFYTNAQKRLSIEGTGQIQVSSPMLINPSGYDAEHAFRVVGTGRIDTGFYVGEDSSSASFISMHRNVKDVRTGEDDLESPYTSTPTQWAIDKNIPVFRIRHPNSIIDVSSINTSARRDFMILPYQYGMAIEYNGIVECWVGEWSVHKGVNFYDVEGKGNGWGAVSWVGDDEDVGGIRMTARNNLFVGGNVNYGEISVERFTGLPHGDLRFRLPSTEKDFQFIYGERGSNNVVATLNTKGIVIPKVPSVATIPNPEKAQIAFDSTDNTFKGYDGSRWISLSGSSLTTGSFIISGNGSSYSYAIPHGLGVKPSYFNVVATSAGAANFNYLTADATNIYVNYYLPPSSGPSNLSWNWQAKP